MKRLFSWILLLGVVLTSLVSCSEVDPTLSLPATDGEKTSNLPLTDGEKTSNLPLTDDTTSEPISPDGKHIAGYDHINVKILTHYLTPGQRNEYQNMFYRTNSWNYGAFVDYYGIDEEAFAKLVDRYIEEGSISWTADVWYGDHYFNSSSLVHPDFLIRCQQEGLIGESVFCRYEGDTVHTDMYYTIDYRLINAVGSDKFEAYENEFAGTENFNVLHFLEYFKIDEAKYLELFPESSQSMPYMAFYIYGTKEMQDQYFCRNTKVYDPEIPEAIYTARRRRNGSILPPPLYIHIRGYSGIASYVTEHFLTPEQSEKFKDMFPDENYNYGQFIDYFGIDKDEFIALVNEQEALIAKDRGMSLEKYRANWADFASLWDIWFSDNYFEHPWLINPDAGYSEESGKTITSVFCRYEGDTVHTDMYYTIDYRLINYVGLDKFEAYKEKYAGTENFNVLHFLDHFGIDKELYDKLWFEENITLPIRAKYVFGTKEMQEEYFSRQSLEK